MSEVRGQRSEVRGQKSDFRGPKSEVRCCKSDVGGPMSEVWSQKAGFWGQTSAVRDQDIIKIVPAGLNRMLNPLQLSTVFFIQNIHDPFVGN